ncbi:MULTISPECIES: VOC family protein [Streptomyces]|uniref:VOC family protein n=1 Tax=Streptomyces lichenis TaxID=2306967 RepID=A0ABT0IJC8_9ACTN|nr:VOC family protein [Streptomyces lichenis]MCK8681412.1 VOC family protein [Streptomyces lichenis]
MPLTLTGTVLDAPDARELAAFYVALLGWEVAADEPEWVKLRAPGGGAALAFQSEPHYRPPVWPTEPGAPAMMSHLDIEAADLAAAEAHARACGAVPAAYQPQDDVRVMLDPAGHPFCLWTPTGPASAG